MAEIHIQTKKSVTLENPEHDPITLNGLHTLLSAAADLNIPGDTVVEFTIASGNDPEVVEVSITDNSTETR